MRFRNFVPAAATIVLSERAVRPWRPMTFPRSPGSDLQLENGAVVAAGFAHGDRIGLVDQRLRDELHEVLHARVAQDQTLALFALSGGFAPSPTGARLS